MFRKIILLFPVFILSLFQGCSGSGESYKRNENVASEEGLQVRVLLGEEESNFVYRIESSSYLKSDKNNLALINTGNSINISINGEVLELSINGRKYSGKEFLVVPEFESTKIMFNGTPYEGSIKVVPDGNEIRVVNVLSIDQYLKGVIPAEMPSGNGNEYYEALKAFSICARTYTFTKIKQNKKYFDVYPDTRDQVYGGSSVEKEIINNVIDETRGLILTYEGKPALTYYHSTCGGNTEAVQNVFPGIDVPYLQGVTDGDEPYCMVSPKFNWSEEFSENIFLKRLVTSGYLNNSNYSINRIFTASYFKSGRINELDIELVDNFNEPKIIKLFGNNIRYILKTGNGKSILESNNFTARIDSDKNIILNGKGYGHGVGLCQWGALAQSQQGRNYEQILSFYYPGTKIEKYND
jgi:stage II sporulation protein D (peptidoglycan lytic transglycosylase)